MEKKKKKILFLIDSLNYGGAERQFVELLKGLPEDIYDKRVYCLLRTAGGYTGQVRKLGIRVNYLIRKSKFDVTPVLRLMSAIKKERTIITAVSRPKVANIGMGAKAITMKPTAVVKVALKRAKPVVREVSRKAAFLSRPLLLSCRKRSAKWIE